MLNAIRRNGILFGGMIACGLLCLMARPSMLSDRGAMGPSVLQAESPVTALITLVIAFGAAAVVAALVARFINAVVGLFALGAGLFALAMRTAEVQDLVLDHGSIGLLAVEAIVLAALLLAATVLVFAVAGPLPDVHAPNSTGKPLSRFGTDALVAASAGAVVLPAVWFFAKSEMKGQVIGAVFVGAMLAGLIGRLWRPHVQPVLLFVSPLVFGAVGYLVAVFMTKGPPGDAFIDGTLSPLAMPMPVDYAAGTLMGVAVGLGWAKSFLVHHHEEKSGPAPAAG